MTGPLVDRPAYKIDECSVVDCNKPLKDGSLLDFKNPNWEFFVELWLCSYHTGAVAMLAEVLTEADEE